MERPSEYKNIFKTTFLFGFVQVFNIIVKVGINKVVAILLGAEGLGMISLFNTSINLVKTGAGLGLSQSAVRDVSEANECNDQFRSAVIIQIVKRIIYLTCLLGIGVTIVLSPVLSSYSFGSGEYTLNYIFLSIAVAAIILNDGQKAILTGMRQLKSLAKASMIGALSGLITALPFYYLFGQNGITPSLIVSALTTLAVSTYFVKKIKYQRVVISFRDTLGKSSLMIKMGISLMLLSFLGTFSDLIVSSYIRHSNGLDMVGYYQAGVTIISSYFGILITALGTDYYPRISAINKDNIKLKDAVNTQSEIGLLLACPMVVLFLFMSPWFLEFLYSSDFIISVQYVDYAVLGTIIIICSNSMGMILLAKQKSSIFLISASLQRILFVAAYIFLYRKWGLTGLGIGYLCMAVVHYLLMNGIMSFFYRINFNVNVNIKLFITLIFATFAQFAKDIENPVCKYSAGAFLVVSSSIYSYMALIRAMKIDPIAIVRNKLK